VPGEGDEGSRAASADLPIKRIGTGVGRDPGLLLANDGRDPLRWLNALPPGERLKTTKEDPSPRRAAEET
jgi:hypothetical protein